MGGGGKGGDGGAGARQAEAERQQQNHNEQLQKQQQQFQDQVNAQQAARDSEIQKVDTEKKTKEASILKATDDALQARLKTFYGPLDQSAQTTNSTTRKATQGPLGE
jgi:hypothetical protein